MDLGAWLRPWSPDACVPGALGSDAGGPRTDLGCDTGMPAAPTVLGVRAGVGARRAAAGHRADRQRLPLARGVARLPLRAHAPRLAGGADAGALAEQAGLVDAGGPARPPAGARTGHVALALLGSHHARVAA